MGHSEDIQDHLDTMERLFKVCKDVGFVLSPKKCCFYNKEAVFCGRKLSGDGISNTNERIAAISKIPYPTDLAQLQQFLCSLNWIRTSLIDFARVSAPLNELKNEKLGKRRSNKGLTMSIKIELNNNEKKAFDN